MAFAPGRTASITYGAATRTFDTWSHAMRRTAIDVSDYDQLSAKFIPGTPVCQIAMSGPYNVGQLSLIQGNSYSIVFGVNGVATITATVLIVDIKIVTKARDVMRVEVVGVVTSDFQNLVSL